MSNILTTNEWILINDIIYRMNSVSGIENVQKTLLDLLQILIPNSASCFFLADETNDSILANGVGIGLTKEDLDEYLENGQSLDYVKDIMLSAKSMVYRETDYFSDEAREATEYYQKYYAPKGFHFCIQVTFSHNNQFLGVLSLYNTREMGDFTQKDIFKLEMLKEHISLRLYAEKKHACKKMDVPKTNQSLDLFAENMELTRRETEVLNYMVNNDTNEEIAERMVISVHTLKKHILNIYKKCDVTNRVQLLKQINQFNATKESLRIKER